jgi:hypothetical protein
LEIQLSAKKVFSKNITIPLVILCIILMGATVGTVGYSLSEISSLKSQVSSSNSEIEALNAAQVKLSDPDNPVGGAKYGSPNLGWTNENTNLYVHGLAFNVGTYPAYDCKIHVVAATPDGTKLVDDYIDLGTIEGGFTAKIDTHLHSANLLTGAFNVTCTPEWL